jgi:Rieske Fe-S protein
VAGKPQSSTTSAGFRGQPGKQFAQQNVHAGKTWVKDRLGRKPQRSLADLAPGEAVVAEVDGEQTAAYRDHDRVLHAVSAVCTHLKCSVVWNDGEKSWDCPCHGSRFSMDGDVLHGPASTPLKRRS